MFEKCPKCSAVIDQNAPGANDRCPSCGVIFAKLLQARQGLPARARVPSDAGPDERPAPLGRLLQVPVRVSSLNFYGRAVLFAFCLAWGVQLYAIDIGDPGFSFMHSIVIYIHEAGHVVFMPFGRFMTILGGSLFQVLVPLILAASFVFGFGGSKRDNFAAALMLWWAGASIMDVAPYIWDAYDPRLMLIGGSTGAESDGHDWQNILGDLGLIRKAHLIGNIDKLAGLAVMILAWAWAALLLRLQYRNKDAMALEEEG